MKFLFRLLDTSEVSTAVQEVSPIVGTAVMLLAFTATVAVLTAFIRIARKNKNRLK